MEWSDIRLFLAIAREGTLGAAARKLGLTQPTMGRRLKTLEAAVGHSLFQRTPDGFVLTDEGAVVMGHAERMEEEAIALQRQLAGTENTLSGTLRISCSDWFGVHVLAPILADFRRVHPNVIIEILTDSRLLNLARREADLVFRIRSFTEPEVISRKLLHIPYGLYVAKGSDDPSPGTGAGFSVIIMDEALGSMPDVAWLKGRFPNAKVSIRSNNRDVQARLCADGAGMAVLPRPLGDSMEGLKRVDVSEAPPGRDTWLGYHQDLRRLPRLRAVIQFVGEQAQIIQRLYR
ncbi:MULTISPECIES: LysR family transcriptional regulator [Ensifer]|uniref:LysR family transcriptional regulator n=1 Tax=Ensifer canadensis TaxID=555315 RepID=A0AAW4FMY1_9HYPH|nr:MULTISPECIES: LysR family transcriptional regulator [Ensifer]KQW34994.1 LysR family transcriptional regulator [Ensifer sp. Root1252]KQW68342.1 LysR family transcriptional regulator [Ensifer sp. Root127]KRC57317.1 LysR family transcriptional regulator [Ensifer sp. Root231]KRC87813.1 LysR family transcriptional regulator [Ensifer sp. Root258]MBM3092746.1 LysR family transcriptional regulator [Ensifer canadensis]